MRILRDAVAPILGTVGAAATFIMGLPALAATLPAISGGVATIMAAIEGISLFGIGTALVEGGAAVAGFTSGLVGTAAVGTTAATGLTALVGATAAPIIAPILIGAAVLAATSLVPKVFSFTANLIEGGLESNQQNSELRQQQRAREQAKKIELDGIKQEQKLAADKAKAYKKAATAYDGTYEAKQKAVEAKAKANTPAHNFENDPNHPYYAAQKRGYSHAEAHNKSQAQQHVPGNYMPMI